MSPGLIWCRSFHLTFKLRLPRRLGVQAAPLGYLTNLFSVLGLGFSSCSDSLGFCGFSTVGSCAGICKGFERLSFDLTRPFQTADNDSPCNCMLSPCLQSDSCAIFSLAFPTLRSPCQRCHGAPRLCVSIPSVSIPPSKT